MKLRFIVTVLVCLLATQVDGQDFLKRLGKVAKQTLENEAIKTVRNGVRSGTRRAKRAAQDAINSTGKNSQDDAQSAGAYEQAPVESVQEEQSVQAEQSASAPASTRRSALAKMVAVVDEGQNIVRDGSGDYIDEYGINHGGGIYIDGMIWAPVNCGYHATKFPYGKLYQWGRKTGQGYTAPFQEVEAEYLNNNVKPDNVKVEIVFGHVSVAEGRSAANKDKFYARPKGGLWNWTENNTNLWRGETAETFIIVKNQANDPCPKGWRVPGKYELELLVKCSSDFVKNRDGQNGRWFSGSKEYSMAVPRIFLPAAGARELLSTAWGRDRAGLYWAADHAGIEGGARYLVFNSSNISISIDFPNHGYAVRCIKEDQ